MTALFRREGKTFEKVKKNATDKMATAWTVTMTTVNQTLEFPDASMTSKKQRRLVS